MEHFSNIVLWAMGNRLTYYNTQNSKLHRAQNCTKLKITQGSKLQRPQKWRKWFNPDPEIRYYLITRHYIYKGSPKKEGLNKNVSDDDVVGSPGELLDIGAVIGQCHSTFILTDIIVQKVLNVLEIYLLT